jgi:hypothetical protein
MTTPTNSHKAWTDKGGHVTDLCVYKVSGALSELFMEACNAPPLKSHAAVELPSLERPTDEESVELAKVHVLRPNNDEPPAS